jgi:hypothetical protein
VGPPSRILGSLGVEEEQVDAAVGESREIGAAVFVVELDARRETGLKGVAAREVGTCFLVGRRVHTHDPAAHVAHRVRQPDRREAVRRADLDDPARTGDANRQAQQSSGGGLEVAVLQQAVWLRGIVRDAGRVERLEERGEAWVHAEPPSPAVMLQRFASPFASRALSGIVRKQHPYVVLVFEGSVACQRVP